MRTVTAALSLTVLMAISAPARALDWELVDWRLGLAYASGLSDVTDLYEENLRLAGFDVDVDLKFPLGLAAGMTYEWYSGARLDVGLGPIFVIGGDVAHSEMPLTITGGYKFIRNADVEPYVRGGLSYHFVDGDQYSSSKVGPFLAVGVDFAHFSLELQLDQSEVEFDQLTCDDDGSNCELGTTDLNTYDVLAAFYWRF